MFFWYLLLLRGNLFCARKWIVELDEEAQRAKRIIHHYDTPYADAGRWTGGAGRVAGWPAISVADCTKRGLSQVIR